MKLRAQSLEGAPERGSCLVGAPPGIFVDGEELYVFVDLGSCPAHLGCFRGPRSAGAAGLKRCSTSSLLDGAAQQGEAFGKEGNPFFDHRFLSSAEVVKERGRYYMLFEGERGLKPPEMDSQWGLGFAWADRLDSKWTRHPDNPILMDIPGNIGIGHGDLVRIDGRWYLYTATSGSTRGRYRLDWKGERPAATTRRLHGTVEAGGAPSPGVRVTAWGQEDGDFHSAETGAEGIYEIVGLNPDSLYNVVVNGRWTDGGYAPDNPKFAVAVRDNVRLLAGPDDWHGEDFFLDVAASPTPTP